MSCLGEEAHPLNAFVVSTPSVQPFLGNEAIMLLLAQVARGLYEAASRCLVHVLPAAMVDCRCLVCLFNVVLVLGFLKSCLAVRLKFLYDCLLLWSHLCHLSCEFLHALVGSPRSFEVSLSDITLLFSL